MKVIASTVFYELPFGAGRRWLKGRSGAAQAFVNWDLGAIFTDQPGRSFTVNRAIDQSLSGAALGVLADRPDQVADPFQPGPVPANPDPTCQLTLAHGWTRR